MPTRGRKYYRPEFGGSLFWKVPRKQFIHALEDTAPNVTEHLERDVWPLYKSLKSLRQYTLSWPSLIAACQVPALAQKLEPLRDGIVTWAKRINLAEDVWTVDPQWMLDTALYSLEQTENDFHLFRGEVDLWIRPTILFPLQFRQDDEGFVNFKVRGWDPIFISLTDYAHVARKTLLMELEEYLESVEAEARKRGWRHAPKKDYYYEYTLLVHKQVLGRSYQEIADMIEESHNRHMDASQVQRTLRKVAQAIGLRLEFRPGRRRKPDR